MAECRKLGIVTAAFYVLGFLQDDWSAMAATIDYSIALGSTAAQFKLLTPYPGTPMWKQLSARVYETDWQQFDGFTPTFTHPSLSADELRFLLGAAYTLSTCGLPTSRTFSVFAGVGCVPPSGSILACAPGMNGGSAP